MFSHVQSLQLVCMFWMALVILSPLMCSFNPVYCICIRVLFLNYWVCQWSSYVLNSHRTLHFMVLSMNSITSIKYVMTHCRSGWVSGFYIIDNEVNLKLKNILLKMLFFLLLGEDCCYSNSVVEHIRLAHEHQCFMGA